MATTEEDRKPEATSSSTKEEQLKKPTKPQHQIFAIRKCDSLKAPAIFFAWEDCEFYVDEEENEGVVDFKGFDLVLDAIKWIYEEKNDDSIPKKTMAAIPAASQETKIRPPPSREKTITNVATTQINKAATKVGKPRVPHTQVPAPFPPGWPYQQFHPMMGQVPYPPHAFLPGHVPHPAYPPYPMPNHMGQPGMPGQGMTTTAPKKKTKTAVRGSPPTQFAVSRKRSSMDASLTNAHRTTPATDRRQQKQYKTAAGQPMLRNWQEQWDEQLELLKKYKANFGDTRVPMSKGMTPRGYDSLRIWLAMARPAVGIYRKNHKASTFLTKAKVQALMDIDPFSM
jgi:hypothetical protein